MNSPAKKFGSSRAEIAAPRQPVVGLEAEFSLLVGNESNDTPRKPEILFGTPRALVAVLGENERPVPRVGRSCHLPSGGALYFDTGVVEVATGLMELDGPAGCGRAVRALWEQVAYVRRALDVWERDRGPRPLRLQGFSTHYNFSQHGATPARLRRTARLLPGVLLAPLALLASNRRSTAVGARPRPGRLEITLDFTPDPALMLATLAFLAGVATALSGWPEAALTPAGLRARGVPYPAGGFRPRKHSSRQGWRAHADDFPENPFAADPHAALWPLADGRRLGLRAWARATMVAFAPAVRRYADRETWTHLREVFGGEARSGLDFPDRPPAYDDVGRDIDWGRRRARPLPRSAYERVIRRVLARAPWRLDGARWRVERMPGWYEFVFREVRTGERRVFNLDRLAAEMRRAR